MRTIHPSTTPRWPIYLVLFSAIMSIGLVIAPTLSAYFFVFDDFKLVGQASEMSLLKLISQPHFHYVRPVVHAWFSFEATLFGWELPSGYVWVGWATHMVNAALLAWLLVRLGYGMTCGLLSGGVVLIAPWTLEAIFWASCRFELFAALGLLVAGHAALGGGDSPSRRRLSVCIAALVFACFSKESAYAALIGLLCAWRYGPPQWRSLVSSRLVAWSLAVLVGGFLCRWLAMAMFAVPDPFGGHQGNLFMLLLGSDAPSNLVAHARAVLFPPNELDGYSWLSGIHALIIVVGLVASCLKAPTQAGFSLCCAGMALLPALWLARDAQSTAGGRLLYLPTLILAPMIVQGWSVAAHRILKRAQGRLLSWVFGLWALCALASGAYQGGLWQSAYGVSRDAITRFEGQGEHAAGIVHVTDMPYVMKEGPYMLKAYAFEWFGGRRGLRVSASPVVYEMRQGRPHPMTRWTGDITQPPSDAAPVRLF